jgi:hypothetical protein
MQHEIDFETAKYLTNLVLSGKMTSDALVQRIGRALKSKNKEQYLTLKHTQALITYRKKVC